MGVVGVARHKAGGNRQAGAILALGTVQVAEQQENIADLLVDTGHVLQQRGIARIAHRHLLERLHLEAKLPQRALRIVLGDHHETELFARHRKISPPAAIVGLFCYESLRGEPCDRQS